MCGIVGYTGRKDVVPILLESLEMLEHRGYDSVGIGYVKTKTRTVCVEKCIGRVANLRKKCQGIEDVSTCGIGHTRWATHGVVCERNAHPHRCGKVTLVHNGIVENYLELARNYGFIEQLQSETDTEVVATLLNHYYQGNAEKSIREVVDKIKGTFAFVVMFDDQPGVIYAVRNVSPIVVSMCEEGMLLASDLTALGKFAEEYFVLPEYAILKMEATKFTITLLNGEIIQPDKQRVDWMVSGLNKEGYAFYMEKEIMEQPSVFAETLKRKIENALPDEVLKGCERICVVACGTAMHAGLIMQDLVKSILRMHIDVELASEFIYSNPIIDNKTLVIAVSQSGETVDTLEALKYAKKSGAICMSVLNVRESSIARESDYVLYTEAGPEIAVASTKAYTTQLAIMYKLVARMAFLRGIMNEEEVKSFVRELDRVPEKIDEVLGRKSEIHMIAREVLEAKDLFMIGRGLDYSILLEGSLKLKEVSYIHSEAYASGELKHGPIALITENTPVIALITQESTMTKVLSNIKEVKARGAKVVLFIEDALSKHVEEDYPTVILPDMDEKFMVFPAITALQLMAYYVSLDKGFDVDKPRNLAKVVTVE